MSTNNDDSHVIMNGNFQNISKRLIQRHTMKGYSELKVWFHAFIIWVSEMRDMFMPQQF